MSLVDGAVLEPVHFEIDRETLVRYAGATGEFSQIHYNDEAAKDAGLPGVIAHGMLVVALVNQAVCRWVGSPTCVVGLSSRFSEMLPVPGRGSAKVTVSGRVVESDRERARIAIEVTSDGRSPLSAVSAEVEGLGRAGADRGDDLTEEERR